MQIPTLEDLQRLQYCHGGHLETRTSAYDLKRGCSVFYDHIIKPGRFIANNAIKPDIVVWDKRKKTAQIIDVCVPNDYGLNRAEREKVVKYQPLKNDLRVTWNLSEAEVIPVVVGATGVMRLP